MVTLSRHCCRNRVSRSLLKFHNRWQERSRTFMSSSINTACRSPRIALVAAIALCVAVAASAQDVSLRAPSGAVAGNPASIGTTGSGSATLYLVGPAASIKREVQLGQDVSLTAKELQTAGR